jgi:hypothetical protein
MSDVTTPKPSRAEYQRARRAAIKAAAAASAVHVCELCGQPFTAERRDARHCTDACRAAAWRRIRHRITAPITGERCFYFDQHGTRCAKPATTMLVSVSNDTRHLGFSAPWCDEHLPELTECDADCARSTGCPAPLLLEQTLRDHALR